MRRTTEQCVIALAMGLGLGILTFGVPACVMAEEIVESRVISLDGPDWKLATDAKNVGREEKWFEALRPEAKATPVPGIVQNIFPKFHGPAWFYREFEAPVNPHKNGRYFVRFGVVDWVAEVWVNGQPVGKHEGGETPFTLEATAAVKPGQKNLLAVRALNPYGQKIDGYTGDDTPQHHRGNGVGGGGLYNSSGIYDAVEFLAVPAIQLADVHVIPDWKTGDILVKATVNSITDGAEVVVDVAIEPAVKSGTIASTTRPAALKTGDNVVEATARVPDHHLWTPDDPFLYRVWVGVRPAGSPSIHRQSVRCGFRDFRFENGYFRLNGRRIVLLGTYYVPLFPLTYVFPHDPELLRRDVADHKKCGFNFMRVFSGRTLSRMMDLCDEMGVMVYQEHYGAWWGGAGNNALNTERWKRSVLEVVRRDRNHPSVIIWGLLNEMGHPKYVHEVLPMIRQLDPTRVVWSNSAGGRPSNPGSSTWDQGLSDGHPYFVAPLSDKDIMGIRGKKGDKGYSTRRDFITEGGWLVAKGLPADLAQFERLGMNERPDAAFFRAQMNQFMADWKQWRLDEIWTRPEDYFADAHRNGARVRERCETAFRSLPGLIGFSPTQKIGDQDYDGGGLTTFFREPKDTLLFDGARLTNAPLRWCLFVTPIAAHRDRPVRFEAVLADLDILKPGAYPARVEILGSDRRAVLARDVTVTLGESAPGKERPFTTPAFDEEIALDVPAGVYEMVVTMAGRQDIPGGRLTFHVGDAKTMPAMPSEVVLWGEDAALANWLTGNGVKVVPFDASAAKRQVIVVGGKAPAPAAKALGELARRIARGCGTVFVDLSVFTQGKDRSGWPMSPQPSPARVEGHPLFRADHWARKHEIFEGLPAGGMIDGNPLYAHLITKVAFRTREPSKSSPTAGRVVEIVAGSICTSSNYGSGIQMAVCELGAGRFILHTLKIEPNLGTHPAADRLLRNMINYAARDSDKPLADLPADFDKQVKAMGYE